MDLSALDWMLHSDIYSLLKLPVEWLGIPLFKCTVSYLLLLFHVVCFLWHAVPIMYIFLFCSILYLLLFFHFINMFKLFFIRIFLYFSELASAKLSCLRLVCECVYQNLLMAKRFFFCQWKWGPDLNELNTTVWQSLLFSDSFIISCKWDISAKWDCFLRCDNQKYFRIKKKF